MLMQRLAFVFASIVCAGHGRRLQASTSPTLVEMHGPEGMRSLAMLLSAFKPAAAFSPPCQGGAALPMVMPRKGPNHLAQKRPGQVPTMMQSGAEKGDAPFVNTRLFRQFVRNQLLLGYPIWTDGFGARLLAEQVHVDRPELWLLGVIGSLPIVAVGRAIETSDKAVFTDLNLSTKMVVMRLFGSKAQPVLALVVSIFLCALTGVVEEIIFRGGVLAAIAGWAVDNGFAANLREGEPLGVILSSLLFALGHINLAGGLSALVTLDTLTLFGLQFVTGLSFALLYVITGELTVPIIAHFLYDLYTLYETHLVLTDQIAYSEKVNPKQSVNAFKWGVLKGEKFVEEARRAFFLMDTNRDEVLSTSELRMGLFSMGLKLNEQKFQSLFESADTDGSNDIDFDEFLEFVATADIDASSQESKRSLLGVRG
mmetsp:Transcript_148492/g.262181  ORF Transcript_148492/g.262181 Transcript_148492/m.262181 type:complete len:426 (-) Transcript_148492:82-1359(-)